MSRTAKSARNAVFGIAVQAATAVLSFVTRTALIRTVGVGAVGLNGLFTDVIAMLSLTEMGVGTAITYHLYRPLAEGDRDRVSRLMDLFGRAYRRIALLTLAAGALLAPWIQYLVREIDYPVRTIRAAYLLFVVQTAASYLFSHKAALFGADQKRWIVSLLTLVVKGIGTVFLILILVFTRQYLLFLAGSIAVNVGVNAAASLAADREYPWLKKGLRLPETERKRVFCDVGSVFVRTLSGRITHSTDHILISVLVNTVQAGFYSNYALFFNLVRQIGVQITGGVAGSLGNLMASEKPERCAEVLRRLTFLYFLMGSVLSAGCAACLSPLVTLWLGADFVLPEHVVLTGCAALFLEFVSRPLWEITTASGLFRQDRNISLLGSGANLAVSVVLGRIWGMSGILTGTVCTYVIQIALKIRLLYAARFGSGGGAYALLWLRMAGAFAGELLLQRFVVRLFAGLDPWAAFFACGCASVLISAGFAWLLFGRTDEMTYAKALAGRAWDRMKRGRA